MFIYRMKLRILLSLLSIFSVTRCSVSPLSYGWTFAFDTHVLTRIYKNNQEDKIEDLKRIFAHLDKLTDNYQQRDVNNIYTINNTNESVTVDPDLYHLLELTFSHDLDSLSYFNPLCGSLSKKWKESLEKEEILSDEIIAQELSKMNNTHLEFLGNNTVKRVGEAEIDLGAVAKGYALDKAKEYFNEKNISGYLIDGGHSSILAGEGPLGRKLKIRLNDAKYYVELKNCFISTSAYTEQYKTINDVIYSHIINPKDGSAVSLHKGVIVISDLGYLGDILSTAFINESIDSIKELEKQFSVKTIVFDELWKPAYQSDGVEFLR